MNFIFYVVTRKDFLASVLVLLRLPTFKNFVINNQIYYTYTLHVKQFQSKEWPLALIIAVLNSVYYVRISPLLYRIFICTVLFSWRCVLLLSENTCKRLITWKLKMLWPDSVNQHMLIHIETCGSITCLFTTEARIRSQAKPCSIYGEHSNTGACLSPGSLVVRCHSNSTSAAYRFISRRRYVILAVDSAVKWHPLETQANSWIHQAVLRTWDECWHESSLYSVGIYYYRDSVR